MACLESFRADNTGQDLAASIRAEGAPLAGKDLPGAQPLDTFRGIDLGWLMYPQKRSKGPRAKRYPPE